MEKELKYEKPIINMDKLPIKIILKYNEGCCMKRLIFSRKWHISTIFTKNKFKENKVSTMALLSILFVYIFLLEIVLLIIYKALSIVGNNMLNVVGLLSVRATSIY